MESWQNLMNTGNDHFSAKNWHQAEYYYGRAISQLDNKLHQDPTCVESIQGWICGYHNLSTLFQTLGDIEKAQKCLLIPHQSMVYLAEKRTDAPDQQSIAMSAIKLTLTPLIEFARKYPTCKTCYDKLMAQYQNVHNDNQSIH